jgi:hypothetical protein
MSSSSLYGSTGNVTVSSKNITTLYNATASNVVTANVPDRNFTTLYGTTTAEILPTRGYGNANVERFLNAGTDGANTVQNINMSGTLYVGGNSYLGNVGNIHIDGGTYNYVLTTDGTGNLSWTEQSGGGGGNATAYIHFDVTSTGNNQTFTDGNLAVYNTAYDMNLFKNGVNIEPFYYEKTANDTVQVNILLNDGDTIDILASSTGGGSEAAGNNFDVQFNGGGILSGTDGFKFNPISNVATVNGQISTQTAEFINSSNVATQSVLIQAYQDSSGGVRPAIRSLAYGNNYSNPTIVDDNSYTFQIQGMSYTGHTGLYQAYPNYAFSGDFAFHKTNACPSPTFIDYQGSFFQITQWGNDGTNDNLYLYELENGTLRIGGFSPTNGFGPTSANFAVQVQTSSGATSTMSFKNNGNLQVPNSVIANYFYGDGGHLSNISFTGNVANANFANFAGNATVANVANSVSVANISGIGNIATINLNGSSSQMLFGNGSWSAGYGNSNVATFLASFGSNSISTTGNANIGNIQLNVYEEKYYSYGNATGTITPDFVNGSIQNLTLTGNITLNSLSNAVAGSSMTLILNQDATGGRTLTSSMKYASGFKTLSVAPSATDILVIFYSGSQYYASLTTGYA